MGGSSSKAAQIGKNNQSQRKMQLNADKLETQKLINKTKVANSKATIQAITKAEKEIQNRISKLNLDKFNSQNKVKVYNSQSNLLAVELRRLQAVKTSLTNQRESLSNASAAQRS